MAVTRADFNLPPVDSGIVMTNLHGASAIAKLTTQISLPGTGSIFHVFKSDDAEYVAEAGLKPIVDTTQISRVISAEKFAKTILLSNELSEDASEVAKAIYNDIPASFGSVIDRIVLGISPKPSGDFDTLSDAAEMELETVADLYEAVNAVEATGATADGILFTSAMLNSLRAKVNALGAPIFNIVGDAINGIPFAVVQNSTKAAFIGPFKTRAVWGVVAGYPKTIPLTETAEVGGVAISLKQRNQFGILGEIRAGFRVAYKTEWFKLVPAVTPEG